MLDTRGRAYFNYLFGGGKGIDESTINTQDVPQFQRMAEVGVQNDGQLLYNNYPENQDNSQFRQTIGRTGKGGITRERNTYNVQDLYDFNSKNSSVGNRIGKIGQAIASGDHLAALSHASTFGGQEFQTDMRVPVSLEQQQKEGQKVPYSINATTIGGNQYRWEPYQLKEGESWEDVARNSFAGNRYKPEGDNLANYANMIIKQNQGNNSNIIYRPVAVDDGQSNDGGILGQALNLAKRYIR